MSDLKPPTRRSSKPKAKPTVPAKAVGKAVRARMPLVLATMHWCWGLGFLTSPKRLRAVRADLLDPAPLPDAASGPIAVEPSEETTTGGAPR